MEVKNGWLYEVWGSSVEPCTWVEQNITLLARGQQTPQRKLKRYEVPKQIEQIQEEYKRGKELTQRQGQQFFDYAIPQAPQQQMPANDRGLIMQMGGGGGIFGGVGLHAQSSTSGFNVSGMRD